MDDLDIEDPRRIERYVRDRFGCRTPVEGATALRALLDEWPAERLAALPFASRQRLLDTWTRVAVKAGSVRGVELFDGAASNGAQRGALARWWPAVLVFSLVLLGAASMLFRDPARVVLMDLAPAFIGSAAASLVLTVLAFGAQRRINGAQFAYDGPRLWLASLLLGWLGIGSIVHAALPALMAADPRPFVAEVDAWIDGEDGRTRVVFTLGNRSVALRVQPGTVAGWSATPRIRVEGVDRRALLVIRRISEIPPADEDAGASRDGARDPGSLSLKRIEAMRAAVSDCRARDGRQGTYRLRAEVDALGHLSDAESVPDDALGACLAAGLDRQSLEWDGRTPLPRHYTVTITLR